MSLETYQQPDELYLARGADVNPLRPLFTGDVIENVRIPEIQADGPAIVIAHPCAMRGKNAQLRPQVLVAAVHEHDQLGPGAWTRGHFDKTPLPDLFEASHHVGRFELIGNAQTTELEAGHRVACLSAFGINLLQQRLVWNLTRVEIATSLFHEAFSHTLEEADLLEEWNDTVRGAGMSGLDAATAFEQFLRTDQGDGMTHQDFLRDPQRRAAVRSGCRAEARRLAQELRSQ